MADNIRVSSRGKCSPFSLFSRRQDPAFDKIVDAVLDKVHLGEKQDCRRRSFPRGAAVARNRDGAGKQAAPAPAGRADGGYDPGGNADTALLLKEIIRDISAIVIEHDLKFVREITSRITVLHKGAILTEGPIEEIATNLEARKMYLGGEAMKLTTTHLTRATTRASSAWTSASRSATGRRYASWDGTGWARPRS